MVQGGNPQQRPDQLLQALSRAGSGPAPQSQVFIGRLVVVFGTGKGTGIFFYSGTPALGNPPILAITTASSDPYGNPVTASAITDSAMPFLVYSGAPTAGNLVASIAPVAGTDHFTNAYQQGVTSYFPSLNLFAQLAAGALTFSEASPAAPGAIQLNGQTNLLLKSPTRLAGGPVSMLELLSESTIGQVLIAQGVIPFTPPTPQTTAVLEVQGSLGLVSGTDAALIAPTAGSPLVTTAAGASGAGVAGNLVISPAADFTSFTVTAATFTQCSKAWSIPANDAQVGTTYRLTVSGNGTQGTTQRALTFAFSAGPDAAPAVLASSFIGISTAFFWTAVFEITVITTGSGGTANYKCAAWAGGSAATSGSAAVGFAQALAFNTTIANTLEAVAEWGSATGAPTFTSFQSFFERIGP